MVWLICDKENLKLKAHLKNKFKISPSSNFFCQKPTHTWNRSKFRWIKKRSFPTLFWTIFMQGLLKFYFYVAITFTYRIWNSFFSFTTLLLYHFVESLIKMLMCENCNTFDFIFLTCRTSEAFKKLLKGPFK